jgi:hypothetical protein
LFFGANIDHVILSRICFRDGSSLCTAAQHIFDGHANEELAINVFLLFYFSLLGKLFNDLFAQSKLSLLINKFFHEDENGTNI